MSLINDTLKNITLKELCIFIICSYLLFYCLSLINVLPFNSTFIYILIIIYFIFKLRNSFGDIKDDISEVFSRDLIGNILMIVVLNILFSYGMLYLSGFILNLVPDLSFLVEFHLSSQYLSNSLVASFVATIIVSPLSEELIFRGVALNRLKILVPTIFAVLITSLLFAALHAYGSIVSAFVFAMCMAILYLKTDNIMVPIFAHFLNNLLAEIIVRLDGQNMIFSNGMIVSVVSILAVISAVLIASSIIKELNKIK